MSQESDAIMDALCSRWEERIRPHLQDTGVRSPWPYNGPVEHLDGFASGMRRLEEIADEGDLSAGEQLAELSARYGPTYDAAKAYKWYYIVLSQEGYCVSFKNENLSPPDYCGPVGDFRNESVVSDLVSGLGFDRVQELDRTAAAWLLQHGLLASGS